MGIYAEDGDPAGDDGRRTSPPPAARWSDSEIRQAIAGANRAIEEAVSDRDGGAAARLYSPDAILYGMGGIERHGRRQVAELYESLFAQGYRELTIAVHEMLRLDDDLVHESGEFTYYHENGVTRLRGRYMSIWRYEDGEWFVYRDLSNI
ncbi:nuclear transport factor 2 family protein [bacterium]|nr:nuclear transport factor 2 family protein [bacterium]